MDVVIGKGSGCTFDSSSLSLPVPSQPFINHTSRVLKVSKDGSAGTITKQRYRVSGSFLFAPTRRVKKNSIPKKLDSVPLIIRFVLLLLYRINRVVALLRVLKSGKVEGILSRKSIMANPIRVVCFLKKPRWKEKSRLYMTTRLIT